MISTLTLEEIKTLVYQLPLSEQISLLEDLEDLCNQNWQDCDGQPVRFSILN